jgi:general secretion pathway protein M
VSPLAAIWQERSPRERAVLALVGGFVAIALLFAFVALPLHRTHARLVEELPRLRASLAALEKEAAEAKRLRALPAVASAPAAANAAVANRPLAGAQVAIVDERHVSLTGADVSFAALLEWLADAQRSGLHVERARIERLPLAGRVRIDVRLARA